MRSPWFSLLDSPSRDGLIIYQSHSYILVVKEDGFFLSRLGEVGIHTTSLERKCEV